MISNINNYSSLITGGTNSASTNDTVENSIAKHSPSLSNVPLNQPSITENKRGEAPRVEDEMRQQANLFLSSKAQKINALSEEFFSAGGPNFGDIESLKIRVYQLGLISKEEYAKLTHTELSEDERKAASDLTGQGIANYIGEFLHRLEETKAGKEETKASKTSDTDDSTADQTEQDSESLQVLKDALTTAKTIIADVDTAKSQDTFKESLLNAMSIIRETMNTKAFDAMPIDDQIGFSKVYQTLELVDTISPQRLTNSKLNKYLEVSMR